MKLNSYGFIDFPEFISGTPTYLPLCLQPSGGNVGIGTTRPRALLSLYKNSSDPAISFQNGNNNRFWIATIGNNFLVGGAGGAQPSSGGIVIDGFGKVGIGTTTPGGQLELSLDEGRKPGTNTWTVISDQRLKNIEGNYTKGLKEILELNPIVYHYKNAGERKFPDEVLKTQNVGFSAQEVQKIFPETIGTDSDGYLTFNMHAIIVAYANAFKEQQKLIDSQKKEIEALNAKFSSFEAVLKALQYQINSESNIVKGMSSYNFSDKK